MFQPDYDPVGESLAASAAIASLPILVMFILLGGLRLKAHIAAAVGLVVSIIGAVAVYEMPIGQALDSGLMGFVYGLFPIMWIVWNGIWLYNLTVSTGHFAVLRRSMASVSPDQRVQAVIVAFCFGALLEALAGFGTPVAVTSVMLIALGFEPFKAASLALVSNTAPVAFGSIAIPIVTLSGVTGLPQDDLGAMVGRQVPLLALVVPLILVAMVDGRRGLRQAWPVAVVGGFVFAVVQFAVSNYISVELTDVAAALAGAGAILLLVKVWRPATIVTADNAEGADYSSSRGEHATSSARATAGSDDSGEVSARQQVQAELHSDEPDTRRDVWLAYAPYLIIVVVFGVTQWAPIKDFMADAATTFSWPGLDVANADGDPSPSMIFNFNYLSAAGTVLLICGALTMIALRISFGKAVRIYGQSLNQLKWATLTVGLVLALAYVLNMSGQTTTLGLWIAGAGGALGLLSPVIGWIGVAITGSDTASNSLFGSLQASAADKAGMSQVLLAAANSSGGVLSKMVSPQNLAIAVAAVGIEGKEGDLFRRVLGWSLALLAIMCLLVYLQTTPVLSWMVV